jgi:NAD(P)-dependent dehydrogenase (short-subunit alcohol dehydrogenase family)
MSSGVGRGIEKAIAVVYAAEGATVVIAEKDSVTGSETEKLITSAGGKACKMIYEP